MEAAAADASDVEAAAAPKPKRKPKPKDERPKEPRKANAYSLFTKEVSKLMKGEAAVNPRFRPVENFPPASKARVVFEEHAAELRDVIAASAGGVSLGEFAEAVDVVVDMRKDPRRRLGFNALVWGMCPEEDRKEWFNVPGAVVPGGEDAD